MKLWIRIICCISILTMGIFTFFGYASVTDELSVNGNVEATPIFPDLYITEVTPNASAGVTVDATVGTVMFAQVDGSGTASFTVEIINISKKVYVFERVIDGAETGVEGVYTGTAITYTVGNVLPFEEIAPNGGTLTFHITITVPRGVTTDNYVLKFNFIEKSGTEILPGYDKFNVTFVYNNGLPNNVVQVHANEFVPRPVAPTKVGYTFIGWYTDLAYTRAWNFEIDKVSQNMTLYAGWQYVEDTKCYVTFIPNNGDDSTTVSTQVNSLISPPKAPEKEGYLFIGWYTDTACTTPWNFDTDKVTSNLVLYGGWELYVPPVPPEHDITFKPNNGDPDTTIVVLTGSLIPRPTTPIREGYVFIGWYLDESYTTAWNFEVNKVDSDVILYGGWEEEQVEEIVEYTITFKPNNGNADSTVIVEEGSLIPRPTAPTKNGYVFAGWYLDAGCTLGWNFDTDKPQSDMTLYGGWEEEDDHDDTTHSDFFGLVEALLSTSNNCLNHNDLIFDAIMASYSSKKRPKEDAPILHSSVNSVSGGTMSAIATFANSKLTNNLHFIFEADANDELRETRLTLYMYYGTDIAKAKVGDEILVYKQIISLDSNGRWFADGSYVGTAIVGDFFGGGNSGKDVRTINAYSWKSTNAVAE